jgi:hypothetical protein
MRCVPPEDMRHVSWPPLGVVIRCTADFIAVFMARRWFQQNVQISVANGSISSSFVAARYHQQTYPQVDNQIVKTLGVGCDLYRLQSSGENQLISFLGNRNDKQKNSCRCHKSLSFPLFELFSGPAVTIVICPACRCGARSLRDAMTSCGTRLMN